MTHQPPNTRIDAEPHPGGRVAHITGGPDGCRAPGSNAGSNPVASGVGSSVVSKVARKTVFNDVPDAWIVVGTPLTAAQVGFQMAGSFLDSVGPPSEKGLASPFARRRSDRVEGENEGVAGDPNGHPDGKSNHPSVCDSNAEASTPPPQDGAMTILGQVLTDPEASANSVAGPVLGDVNGLPEILADAISNPGGPDQAEQSDGAERSRSTGVVGVVVCLPTAMAGVLKAVVEQCAQAGVSCCKVPAMSDLLHGRVSVRPGAPADATADLTGLIGRAARPVDRQVLDEALSGRTVMITGAGGSIGSEMARQIAELNPARLLMVERGENPLFEIDREIAARFPALPRQAILHDVSHADATIEMCSRHLPEVVFHAAAHKHVPMMEDHPAAAVENNFYGTRSIIDAAVAADAERFVMISTDKAVNPSSVMGATKRLAELYVADLDQRLRADDQKTICSMVRFGNVLGSACSLLPIWTKQVARGGPITVTDARMTRYFMTIPEAASLVMQAGATATGGEVFLLDMGEPVRILDLARRFLAAQGLEPDRDVRIQITGARPGEKLFEELAYGSEDMRPTSHEGIRIWSAASDDAVRVREICQTFDRMRTRAGSETPWSGVTAESVVAALRASVPEMVRAVA